MTRDALSICLLAALASAAAPTGAATAAEPTEEQARFFESKIRPLLAEHCTKCHGPDKQKGGLRLDSRAAILAGGDSGSAVEPGDPEASPLILAVRYDDEPRMPPSKKLPGPAVEALTQWVRAGAPWPGEDASAAAPAPKRGEFAITDEHRAHWAFRPIRRPEPPEVANPGRVANPIDAFIQAGLAARGLEPNPPATRVELIRRVTFDLTGLPPTPEEVDAFLADEAPDAYGRLVDRLLASPRYGEKWGRHWLDLVRFAETNSYERDNPKPSAWRYRDYVIRSLNDDKPFDRFIREQLAGDELPDGSPETITGTGYYRLGIWDDEPTDREQAEFDGLDDIVATTGQVFLGLTVDCARCHDHKIDPIPQRDYYKLVAFFRNIQPFRNGGPTDELPYVEPGQEAAVERRGRELEQKRAELRKGIAGLEEEFIRRAEADPESRPDVEDLRYRFYRDTWDRLPDFDALKPEETGVLPAGRFDLATRSRDDAFGFVFEGTLVVPADGTYTFRLDSDDGARLRVGDRVVIDHDGLHELGQGKTAEVALAAGRVPIRLDYFQKSDRLGLRASWSGPGFERRPLSAPRPGSGAAALAERIEKDGLRILGPDRLERYRVLRQKLEELKDQKAVPDSILRVTERGREAPPTHVLARGNAHAPGDPVEPGFLEVLGVPDPSIPEPPADARTTGRRRVLADWIASADNPLTARVIANRVWQHHFGRGIVRSSNNFGLQGDAPTHPELLDWLASELIGGGWRLKALHRTIVTSDAYRMSSRPNPEALAKDPTNDAFWRFDMRRLSAEEVRDAILAVSGSLNLKMYGPGVYPEIPAEVMAGQSVPGKGWGQSPPEEQARRSVYVHVKRSLLLPILESFDVAETDRSSPNRFSTTQPTQALAMLNGGFLNQQAGVLAERVRREAGDDLGAQVRWALRLAVAREPDEAEVRRGVDLIESLRAEGMADDDARRAFALMVLNLNEFLYLD